MTPTLPQWLKTTLAILAIGLMAFALFWLLLGQI
jgi:hypothetical protein